MPGKLRNLWAVLAAVAFLLVCALIYCSSNYLLALMSTVHKWILVFQHHMADSWLAFGLGQIVIAGTGLLPASIIAVMAGATFGLAWGLVISVVGTMLGGWLAFWLSRSILRRYISGLVHRHPAAASIDQVLGKDGWRTVLLLRVSPIMPFALTSYGLGLSQISQRDFLLGTLASLPALVGYVALGAAGRQGILFASSNATGWHGLSLIGGAVVIFYAMDRLRRAMAQPGPASS